MTILGEYVAAESKPVRSGVLVAGLGLLGVAPASARQAIARAARNGWLAAVEAATGRGRCWELTRAAREWMAQYARRFARVHRGRRWDGQWLLIGVTVPETDRQLRHRLRANLAFEGFGSLGQGWWINADLRAEEPAVRVLANLGLEKAARSFVVRTGTLGSVEDLVAQAWDLKAAHDRYEQFIADFSGLSPDTPPEAWAARTRLVHAWQKALLIDPRLPPQLLPVDWPGLRATSLQERQYRSWLRPAQQWWDLQQA